MHHNTFMRLMCLFVIVAPLSAYAQSWSPGFGAPPGGKGVNGDINVLFVYQNKLIAGGGFTQAGSIAANRIAAWDGSQWSAFGPGFGSGQVFSLTEYNGELIAGGGAPTGENGFLMRWDGANWLPLIPTGATRTHRAAHSHDGLLYVNTRDASGSRLAWWNGSVWSSTLIPTDPFGPNFVSDLASYGGQLYLTGSAASGGPQNIGFKGFLFSWNGEGFGGPGYVIDGDTDCLHVHDGLLFVCGAWQASPPIAKPNIAAWQGASWVTPLAYSDSDVYGMDTFHGRLVVGLDTFHGAQEVFIGGGAYVWTVKVFQDALYVGGSFDTIDNPNFTTVAASNIAKWTEPITAVREVPVAGTDLRVHCSPNPFNPSVTISIDVPVRGTLTVFIYDATGQTVKHLSDKSASVGPHHLQWDGTSDSGAHLASGVYFARASVAGRTGPAAKLVLLK